MFRVSGQEPRAGFPARPDAAAGLSADEWAQPHAWGWVQRARATRMRSCVTFTPSKPSSTTASSGCTRWTGHPDSARRGGCPRDPVRAHDQRHRPGLRPSRHWMVLEDNLRIPSGTAYAIVNRRLLTKHLPELDRPGRPRRRGPGAADAAGDAARRGAAAGRRRAVGGAVVRGMGRLRLVRAHVPGRRDGHRAGAVLGPVGARRKTVAPHRFWHAIRSTCCTRRMDEDMLLSSTGYDGAPLRPGLLEALSATGR